MADRISQRQEQGPGRAKPTAMDQTFWEANGEWISAAITMALAVAIAFAVDRFVIGRAGRLAERVGEGGISRGTETRLRLIRRLVFAAILVIGAALALSQFDRISKLATGILASSAVLGVVLGLAARQVLANPVAGLLLAMTQPIRIGDTITIEGSTGRVDDLTLSYTFVDTGDGRLMVVPNEKVVTTVVFNRSTGDRSAPATASVWLPPDANLSRARRALDGLETSSVGIAEITADGVRMEIKGKRDPTRTVMAEEEAALREHAHEVLREAGLLHA
jgi:small-conductance mechanosensitive channel